MGDLRKSKHATEKKYPFQVHFGLKPNTELSLARDKILANASDQSALARSLLKPEDRHSQDYSLDRVKVLKHGSLSPDVAPRFKNVVTGQKIAENQYYKALENLALAANRSSQLKPKITVETGRKMMRELLINLGSEATGQTAKLSLQLDVYCKEGLRTSNLFV